MITSRLEGFGIGWPQEEMIEISLAGPVLCTHIVPAVGLLVAIRVQHLGQSVERHRLRLGEDRLELWSLTLERPHHDVPAHLEVVAGRPGMDGCRDELWIFAPIAQRAELAADGDRDHVASALLQGAKRSELRG